MEKRLKIEKLITNKVIGRENGLEGPKNVTEIVADSKSAKFVTKAVMVTKIMATKLIGSLFIS